MRVFSFLYYQRHHFCSKKKKKKSIHVKVEDKSEFVLCVVDDRFKYSLNSLE